MKICIPYPLTDIGGPVTFVKNFTAQAQKMGHTNNDKIDDQVNICLVIAECPLSILQDAKRRKIPIILRLDGVYHPGIPGLNGYIYRWKNRNVKAIYDHHADFLIYQSNFAKASVEYMFGKSRKPGTIIYNGVPEVTVEPRQTVHTPLQLVTWAKFRRPDQILPLIASVKKFQQPYQFTIFGSFTPKLRHQVEPLVKNHPIFLAGPLPATPQTLSTDFDLFLFSDQSACPNSVLEALSFGLPVVAFDRGSIHELVQHNESGQVVSLPSHNPWHKPYQFLERDFANFSQAIAYAADNFAPYRLAALNAAATKFSLSAMSNQYITLMTSIFKF